MQHGVILEDLSDKIDDYEAQLNNLRFDADVEQAYNYHIIRSPSGALAVALMVTFVWCAFCVMDILRIRQISPDHYDWLVLLWFGARWVALGFLIAVLWIYGIRKNFPVDLVWWTYVIIGVAVAISSNVALSKDLFAADSSQILVIMCGFLPIGLIYRRALPAVLLVAVFSLAALVLEAGGRAVAHQVQLALMILIAVPAAAIGGYYREKADRRQFVLSLLLEKRACTDVLTNLPNRRRYMEHLDALRRHADQEGTKVGVAIADLDYFKQYNDRYGHPAGDRLINAVGEAFRKTVRRPFDMVARYGGEEFAFVFSNVDQAGLDERCQAALQSIRDLQVEHRGAPSNCVTASLGYCLLDGGKSAEAAIAGADEALYAAKAGGKDQVRGAVPD